MTEIIDSIKANSWLLPLILFGGGVALGVMVNYIVLPIARRLVSQTKWRYDDVIVYSLRGMPILWGGILGARFAVESIHSQLTARTIGMAADFLRILFIASLTLFAARIVTALMQRRSEKGQVTAGISLFANIGKVVVFVVGLLIILDSLGIAITPIITALGVGGLAVALALQDTLSNIFAGIHIIASKQIRAGDYVKLDSGDEGYVNDISWRNTSIRALANNMIIVPNSKMASAIVVNFHQPSREMGMGLTMGVGYDSDLEKVERVAIQVAKEVLARTPGVVKEVEPAVRFSAFSDYKIEFAIGFRINEFTDQYLVKHELVKAIHKRFQAEGIEIPCALRTIMHQKSDKP